jgi:1,4-alpha-glucan branching enzyme
VARDDYVVGVPKNKTYKLILNSEDEKFNGSDVKRQVSYKAVKKPADGKEYSIAYKLPAYGVAVFKF